LSTDYEAKKFTDYPFPDSLQQDIAAAGFDTPTPIQAECIPLAMEGKDLIGLAQTGTGKTAAFALPIISRLAHSMDLGALVLAPTRELVAQIVGVFRALGRTTGLRVASIVGGVKMDLDHAALRSWPNVLIATPGRLIDHLEQKTVNFKEIQIFTVDEADRMHDMGFIPQIRRIIAHLPEKRQTMMFTATMPADVEQIARRHMRDPVRIQVGPASRPVERAEQQLYHVEEAEKIPLLLDLLRKETGRVLVFVRTKRGVDRLARRVMNRGHRVARLHGDREQNQRDEAMKGFREGRYHILLATDIAARGLDVADIEHVINYDFPRSPEDYVHRIGRTARLEASGRASSFVTPGDRAYVHALEKLIGRKLAPASGSKPAAHAHEPGDTRHAAPSPRHAASTPRHAARPAKHAPAARHPAHPVEHAPAAQHPAEHATAAAAPGQGQPGGKRRRRGRRGRGKGVQSAAATPSPAPAIHAGPVGHHAAEAPAAPPSVHPATPAPAAASGQHGPGRSRRRRGRQGRGEALPPATESLSAASVPYDDPAELAAPVAHAEPAAPPSEAVDVATEPTVIEWD
jgi:ATP-dependent RNA helicase RhlE